MNGLETVRQMVSLAEYDRLKEFVGLLGKWRRITNLIAEDSFEIIWERHILDSIFLQQRESQAQSWLDLGSGAGLPAVVIAALIADKPGARVHCVEIDRRKCAFLREVAAKLSLPMKIHNTWVEDIDAEDLPDIGAVTARAFSSLARIVDIAGPFLSKGAIAVLPRGRQGQDEVAALDRARYSIQVTHNPASDDGVFIQIRQRAPYLHE